MIDTIKIFNNKEYKLVTIRGRSKYISKDGDAFNPIHTNQKATIHINPDGYPCFGGGIPVHIYVATAWVDGYFEGAEVDHIDYNRLNYSADNLRWVSHMDNVNHSHIDEDHYTGNHAGANNGRSTFSENDVQHIKELFKSGASTMDVIKLLHPEMSYSDRKKCWSKYNRIKTGETWNM